MLSPSGDDAQSVDQRQLSFNACHPQRFQFSFGLFHGIEMIDESPFAHRAVAVCIAFLLIGICHRCLCDWSNHDEPPVASASTARRLPALVIRANDGPCGRRNYAIGSRQNSSAESREPELDQDLSLNSPKRLHITLLEPESLFADDQTGYSLFTSETCSERRVMDSASHSILIVDDEADIRDSVADILTDFGYDVATAANGNEALALISERSFDVALLDFRMPGMDGLTLFRELRRRCPETSAILVSAYTEDGVAEEALESGIRRVITKPVDMGVVIAEVDKQLDRPLALVVDDDQDFCASLRDVLDDWGYRVSLAGSEEEAGRLLQDHHPQVVVLDVVLGSDSDPGRVLQTIKDSTPDAEVVLVTGHRSETEPVIGELVDSGAAAVCFKPLDLKRLLELLPAPV